MVLAESENKRPADKTDGNLKKEMESTEPMVLTQVEKRFLLVAERGDIAGVKKILDEYQGREDFDINCVDSLNRSALVAAIENENLDLIEVLLERGIQVKDALLHAIKEEYVEAVEVLLEWEESTHKENDPYSWEAVDRSSSNFTPDITPLILAAHVNNYEILKILLDRGATLPLPHEIRTKWEKYKSVGRCACDECIASRNQDSLRHSQSRINSYRALTAPSLIALSSRDPLLTAFELSWDLRRMSRIETEFRAEYNEMRQRCQEFATALLDHTRTSHELEIMLNYDPEALPLEVWQPGDRQTLERLKMAIKYKQKQFVAHPNVQQLLAAIWYEGLPGFRRKGMVQQIFELGKLGAMFPMNTTIYMMAPNSETGLLMKKPFVKFVNHSASYSFFLMLLGMASQRVETLVLEWFGPDWVQELVKEWQRKERGSLPGLVETVIIIYIISLIWSEVRALWKDGIMDYISDLWNIVDFITFSFYSAWIFMRATAFYLVHREGNIGVDPYYPREKWDMFDPMLLSEGAFAAGMIFSFLKLVHIFSVNPHLGPLQISLGRMIIDILKFFFIYTLVLFAFGCGLNQLLWYYAELEKRKCYHTPDGEADFEDQDRACSIWRRFSNLFETSQSLFWAGFGLVDLMNFELTGIKGFTRFWALLMFGSYSVINIIVLLNMLIAMMSNSYQIISERSDTEWKFARSKLWMSYFEDGDTVPAPFNLLPTMKNITRIVGCRSGLNPTESMKRKSRGLARERYEHVMRLLVRRYVTAEQRKRDEFGITEDDVMEIRQDISTLRFELIDILKSNGMVTPNLKKDEASATGKKGRVMERRLLKDFQIGFVEGFLSDAMKAGPENKNIFSKLAKAIGRKGSSTKGKKDWNALVRKGTVNQNPIGSTTEAQARITRQSARRHILECQKTPLNMDPEKLLMYNPKLSDISPAARVAYAKFKISKIKNEFNRGETPDISRESSIKANDFRPRTPIMEDQREGTITPTGVTEDLLVIVNEQQKPSQVDEESKEAEATPTTSIVETPPTPTEGSPGSSPPRAKPVDEPPTSPPRKPMTSPKPPLGPGWF